MKAGLLHFVIIHEHPDAAPGVYAHALETAAWLRDNDLDEAAGHLEELTATAEQEPA